MLALSVGVSIVVLQDESNLYDEVGLKEVPVVVRHTVGNDVLSPLLKARLNKGLIVLKELLSASHSLSYP